LSYRSIRCAPNNAPAARLKYRANASRPRPPRGIDAGGFGAEDRADYWRRQQKPQAAMAASANAAGSGTGVY
jgi:hypothetical protein